MPFLERSLHQYKSLKLTPSALTPSRQTRQKDLISHHQVPRFQVPSVDLTTEITGEDKPMTACSLGTGKGPDASLPVQGGIAGQPATEHGRWGAVDALADLGKGAHLDLFRHEDVWHS